MHWGQLLPVAREALAQGGRPDAIVLHLGGNDLAALGRRALLESMQSSLPILARLTRPAEIIFSEIIARRAWRGEEKPGAIEKSRQKLNIMMNKVCKAQGWGFVRHGFINLRSPGYHVEHGVHLTGVGMDMVSPEHRGGTRAVGFQLGEHRGSSLRS